jgi:small subunit ribosomal protein S6
LPYYESVFIARQDISAPQVEALTDNFVKAIEDNGGKVAKQEYWGLKNLSYRIKKNRKGHYVLFNIDGPSDSIEEMERQMRLHEDILRYLTIRVDELEEGPSAMMQRGSGRDDRHRRDDRGRRGEFDGRGPRHARGPAGVRDAKARPPDDKQAETRPSDDKQAKARPNDDKQAETRPSDDKQAKARPTDDKQAETRPSDDKQAKARPTDDKQAETRPSDDKQGEKEGEQ